MLPAARRFIRLLPSLVVACAALATAGEARAEPLRASSSTSNSPSRHATEWTFRAASPVAHPPTICADGTVYVPTAEGALHALGADGAFRWSYNVSGRFSGSGACDAAGNLYFATTDGRLYVLSQRGTSRWVQRLPIGARTNVVWGAQGVAFFGGTDSRVWAVSTRAGVLWRSEQRAAAADDVVLARGGRSVLTLSASGLWRVSGLFRAVLAPLSAAPQDPAVVTDEASYVVAGGVLHAFSPTLEPRWSRASVSSVGASDDRLVVTTGGRLCDLRTDDGSALRCAALPRGAVAPPTVVADVAVVASDKSLTTHEAGESAVEVLPLDATPLFSPTASPLGVIAVVVLPGGVVVGVSLPARLRSPQAPTVATRNP